MGEKKLFQTDKAAVAAEPVQGEGGFIAPPGYFQELVKICCKRRKPLAGRSKRTLKNGRHNLM